MVYGDGSVKPSGDEIQTILLRLRPLSCDGDKARMFLAMKRVVCTRNGIPIGKHPAGAFYMASVSFDFEKGRCLLGIVWFPEEMRDEVLFDMLYPLADWSVLEPWLDLTTGPTDSAAADASGS